MIDRRIKELMRDMGMPDSKSLYVTIQQVANEIEQEAIKRHEAKSLHLSRQIVELKRELAEARGNG